MNQLMGLGIEPFAVTFHRLRFIGSQGHMKSCHVRLAARQGCHGVGAVAVAQINLQL